MELPENLEGRTIVWSAPTGEPLSGVGLVIADWRGRPTEDIMTRQPTIATTVTVEDAKGQRRTIPEFWIDEVTG
jgi:hypothetical protein